ncbi:hypothetical protein RN001_003194 [Aquatica leii]|uniref:Uncharacterized protein n=1 Tax=Aquatica leii TaxID=1421715 RepID=A0AAN7QNY5_9COLE|nr:hypothetical protein RN001_003194 [Aquatica leii]
MVQQSDAELNMLINILLKEPSDRDRADKLKVRRFKLTQGGLMEIGGEEDGYANKVSCQDSNLYLPVATANSTCPIFVCCGIRYIRTNTNTRTDLVAAVFGIALSMGRSMLPSMLPGVEAGSPYATD